MQRCKQVWGFKPARLIVFLLSNKQQYFKPKFLHQPGRHQPGRPEPGAWSASVCVFGKFFQFVWYFYIDTIFYVQLDIVYMNREWTKKIAEEKISSNEESWAKNGPCYNSRISLARLKSSLSLSICFRPDSGESCSGHFSYLQKEICNGMSASPRQKSYRMWNSFKHNEIKFECLIF